MKASTFIKVALIDQMQQIADLGLWFHVSRLIPPGVELLARVFYAGPPFNYDGNVFLPETIERMVKVFYEQNFPDGYEKYPDSSGFFNIYPKIWLTSDAEDAGRHNTSDIRGNVFIHVPQWFEDFKAACQTVLDKIESGELEDIEVLKTLEP